MPAFWCKIWGQKVGGETLGDVVGIAAGHLVVEEESATIDLFQAGYTTPTVGDIPGKGVPATYAGSVKRHPGGKISVTYTNGFDKESKWPEDAKPLAGDK